MILRKISHVMKNERIGFDAVIYGLYAVLIPFNMILNFTGSTINKQVGMVTGVLLLLACLMKHRTEIKTDVLTPELLFVLYVFLTMFWSIDQGSTQAGLITLISLMFLFTAGTVRRFNRKETLVISILMIASCMIVPFMLEGNNAISVSRGTLVSSAGTADQNSLAANMVFSCCIAFDLIMKQNTVKAKLPCIVAFLIILIGIITTGSRGSTLTLILVLAYYILKIMPELRKKKSFWFIVIAVLAGAIALFNYIQNNMSQALLQRFSFSALKEDQGNGRAILWKDFLEIAFNDPIRLLFGYGYGASASVHKMVYSSARVPHNVYIQMIIEVGVIGFALFGYMLGKFWGIIRQGNSILGKALFFAVLLEFMTLGFFDNKGTWNVLLLCVLLSLNNISTSKCGTYELGEIQ